MLYRVKPRQSGLFITVNVNIDKVGAERPRYENSTLPHSFPPSNLQPQSNHKKSTLKTK